MGQLEDMAMFVRIIEAGGIGRAAAQLNVVNSAVSRRLHELEKRLGTQLISRTTRSYHLTEAGQHYYERALGILGEVEALNERTSGNVTGLDGTLKLTVPLSFGLMHLGALIDEFSRRHPAVQFQLDFSDRQVDLVEEGFELAIRIGVLKDSSYQAKRLTPVRHALVASPGYLRTHGRPAVAADLEDHAFLQYGTQSAAEMRLTDALGHRHYVALRAKMKSNNGDFLKDMALRGQGVAYLPTFLVYREFERGELEYVCPDYQLPLLYAYAVYPKNRFLSRRCRLFIDFMAQRLGGEPYWDRSPG